jgi:hypothetical protein
MHRQEEYKGHSITVHTFKRGEGFGWSYQIDGGPVRESRDRPLRDEDQAKAEIHGL